MQATQNCSELIIYGAIRDKWILNWNKTRFSHQVQILRGSLGTCMHSFMHRPGKQQPFYSNANNYDPA